jgi:hypothetical protein
MIMLLTFTHVLLIFIINIIAITLIFLYKSRRECVDYLNDIRRSQLQMAVNITTLHNRPDSKSASQTDVLHGYISCDNLLGFIEIEKEKSRETFLILNAVCPAMKELHSRSYE